MSSHEQTLRAGEPKGRTQEKANQTKGNIGQKAQDVKEKPRETAQSGKDNSEGFIQQAVEKVRGVADSVKNTFGMAHNDEHPPRNN